MTEEILVVFRQHKTRQDAKSDEQKRTVHSKTHKITESFHRIAYQQICCNMENAQDCNCI